MKKILKLRGYYEYYLESYKSISEYGKDQSYNDVDCFSEYVEDKISSMLIKQKHAYIKNNLKIKNFSFKIEKNDELYDLFLVNFEIENSGNKDINQISFDVVTNAGERIMGCINCTLLAKNCWKEENDKNTIYEYYIDSLDKNDIDIDHIEIYDVNFYYYNK